MADKPATEKGPDAGPGHKDGVFDGTVRYDGTVLVDREIDGSVVSVLTDKPRKGDKIQARELNTDTGKLERSKENRTDAGSAPPKH